MHSSQSYKYIHNLICIIISVNALLSYFWVTVSLIDYIRNSRNDSQAFYAFILCLSNVICERKKNLDPASLYLGHSCVPMKLLFAFTHHLYTLSSVKNFAVSLIIPLPACTNYVHANKNQLLSNLFPYIFSISAICFLAFLFYFD